MSYPDSALTLQSLTHRSPQRPLLVFLPGMDGTGLSLQQQVGNLQTEFDLCFLAIPPDDRTGWSSMVKQTLALMKAERGSQRPIYLAGESFGGCLALLVALQAPELLDGLILINSATSFHRQAWQCWGANLVSWMPDALYSTATIGLLPFLINLRRVPRSTQKALRQAMQAVTPRSAAWRISLLCSFQLEWSQVQALSLPTLIIASGADQLLDSQAEAHRLSQLLPDAKTVLLPLSGHACLLEPGVCLASILKQTEFLAPRCPASQINSGA
ncbi:alpha/beta fold hydrolase [Lyngbya confervoides]|uniref:Alpha/beta hydrolase n=1 Tax=Lyngbya confervoides BDU141951 TaxID=1574623 RepID=A0ABD4T184_9CYAN|nr:alpha/beta hydrolase [Lyngbya confervoides]MCM1982062.1 alpha/beta hydrolase [Lyngbya confervoides BDU141951]